MVMIVAVIVVPGVLVMRVVVGVLSLALALFLRCVIVLFGIIVLAMFVVLVNMCRIVVWLVRSRLCSGLFALRFGMLFGVPFEQEKTFDVHEQRSVIRRAG